MRLYHAAAVGGIALPGPSAFAQEPPLAEGVRVELVSLNAWGLPAPFAPNRRGRLAATADWLDGIDADVVALQEVWSGAVRHYRRRVHRSDQRGDDGLALDAPRGLTELNTLRFSRARGFDALKQKGALRGWSASIGAWVVSTHLQSGAGRKNAEVRRSQLTELVTWLAPLRGSVIVLGDLNLEQDDATDRATASWLAAERFDDVATTLGTEAATYPGNGQRYDRVLARSGTDTCIVPEAAHVVAWEGARLSDHFAVVVRLRVVPGAAAETEAAAWPHLAP